MAPRFDKAHLKQQESEMREKLQQLHDEGVIDLDAPFREIVPVIERQMKGDGQGGRVSTNGYWLVGSETWFRH